MPGGPPVTTRSSGLLTTECGGDVEPLFFPAEVLSRDGNEGLDLDRVIDVLLRLEYVSVAR